MGNAREGCLSLQKKLVALSEQNQQRLGDNFNIFVRQWNELKAEGLVDRALQVGKAAPRFILPDGSDRLVSLSELLKLGPVVLIFYHGEWSPSCNLQLSAYQQMLSQVEDLDATLVAISPEAPAFGRLLTEKQGLAFPVLSDYGNEVANQFGLVFAMNAEMRSLMLDGFGVNLAGRNADGLWKLPIPGTFVLDTEGIIRFAHVDPDFMTSRTEPEEILKTLRSLKESSLAATLTGSLA
jgi:peroxiredoxin